MFEAIAARWKLAVEIREPACESFMPTYSKIFSETFAVCEWYRTTVFANIFDWGLIQYAEGIGIPTPGGDFWSTCSKEYHWNHVSSAKHNPQRFLLLSHGLLQTCNVKICENNIEKPLPRKEAANIVWEHAVQCLVKYSTVECKSVATSRVWRIGLVAVGVWLETAATKFFQDNRSMCLRSCNSTVTNYLKSWHNEEYVSYSDALGTVYPVYSIRDWPACPTYKGPSCWLRAAAPRQHCMELSVSEAPTASSKSNTLDSVGWLLAAAAEVPKSAILGGPGSLGHGTRVTRVSGRPLGQVSFSGHGFSSHGQAGRIWIQGGAKAPFWKLSQALQTSKM